jgi:hypothetical protein
MSTLIIVKPNKMENVITEVLKKTNGSIINLGTANGWNQANNDQYQALRELMVKDSQSSRNLGRCYNEYSFDALIEGERYTIVHSVDSGD